MMVLSINWVCTAHGLTRPSCLVVCLIYDILSYDFRKTKRLFSCWWWLHPSIEYALHRMKFYMSLLIFTKLDFVFDIVYRLTCLIHDIVSYDFRRTKRQFSRWWWLLRPSIEYALRRMEPAPHTTVRVHPTSDDGVTQSFTITPWTTTAAYHPY